MVRRSGAIDGVRVAGIVAIVAGHTWDNEIIRMGLYTWHVPLFFFLTGYLWSVKRDVWMEARQRARTLLVPYAVWLFLIGTPFILRLVAKGDFDGSVLMSMFLGGNHLGRPFSAFWFVTALFAATVILRCVEKLPVWVSWLLAAGGLSVAYMMPTILAAVPLSFGVALPALFFVLAGRTLRKVRQRLPSDLVVGLGLIASGAILIMTKAARPFDIKQSDFGTPVVSVLMACMVSAGALILAELIYARIKLVGHKMTSDLAQGGFMVVLSHAVPLWLLGVGPQGSWTGFGLSLVVPWVAALVVQRTAFAPLLCGTARRPIHAQVRAT